MSVAVIALGANLGDPAGHLHRAAHQIADLPGIDVTHRSHLYRTAPVGGPEQPDYVNAVMVVETTRTPRELLGDLQAIEADHGRVRDVRWGPRTLDLDLIAYDAMTLDDPDLEIPHPRAHERAFVLVPWHDADADASLPGHGPVVDLLRDHDTAACTVVDGGRVGET